MYKILQKDFEASRIYFRRNATKKEEEKKECVIQLNSVPDINVKYSWLRRRHEFVVIGFDSTAFHRNVTI